MPKTVPSAKRIHDFFKGDRHHSIDLEAAEKIRKQLQRVTFFDSLNKVYRVLQKVDELLGSCGVEEVRTEDTGDPHESDLLALYCNTGDTYSPTVAYSVKTDTWRLCCWGDFVGA